MRNKKVSFGDMGLYGSDISDEMNKCLDDSWKKQYGLMVTDVAMGDINLTDESMKRVSRIDDAKIFSDPTLQSGLMASASAEAMESAASNEAGSMMGFMGMGLANQTGANMINAVNQNLNNAQTTAQATPQATTQVAGAVQTDTNAPKFCSNCGAKLTGKFCSNCGKEAK